MTSYDSWYIALAEVLEEPLATCDLRLTRVPGPRCRFLTPPAAPVSAGDLSSTMISFKAPRYPIECRRKKEQGVVLLSLLLGVDGTVAEISVRQSSGFDRLDRASLAAQRRLTVPFLRQVLGAEPE